MYILDNKIYAEYGNIPESILSETNSPLYWIDDGEDLSNKIPYSGKQLDGREYDENGEMKEDVWIIGHPILESPPHPVYITISRLPGTIDYEFDSSNKEQAKEKAKEAKEKALEYLKELKKVSGAYASNADIYCRPKGTNSFKINRK